MQLDFTEFHPLDHPVWRCMGYPGGPRRHLTYRWDFQWSERVAVLWKHATRRHEWRPWAARDRFTGEWLYHVSCAGCDARPDLETKERLIAAMKARPLPDFNT